VTNSRSVARYTLSKTIELRGFQREAARLVSEIKRLEERIAQVKSLEESYRQHLAMPNLSVMEYRSVIDIFRKLGERKTIDEARLELLVNERIHITQMLAQKQQHINKLEDEVQKLRKNEQNERDARAERLIPARRNSNGI
jgi:DNA repair exonuclease SbcCD ATPase subunit